MNQPPQPAAGQQSQPNSAPYTPADWPLIGNAVVEAWKKTVDVQQQFNDIELRIRNYAITLLVAIVGAAGYAANAKITVKILRHDMPLGAPLLLAGLVSLAGFYFMDRFWYHRLLQGAVKHGMAIEERCKDVCDAIGLSVSIKKESPITVSERKSKKIHSEGKIDIFYGVIALMLILMIVAFCFLTP